MIRSREDDVVGDDEIGERGARSTAPGALALEKVRFSRNVRSVTNLDVRGEEVGVRGFAWAAVAYRGEGQK